MTTQPNTGPAELRRLADVYKHAIGWGAVHNFNELAAAWEAADARAARAEAALAQARALVPFLRGWIETMQSEQGYEYEGTMAWRSWQDMIAEVENVIAALSAPDGAR